MYFDTMLAKVVLGLALAVSAAQAQFTAERNRNLYWDSFQTVENIHGWFEGLAEDYPSIVTLLNIGTSHEGRNLTGIKISRNANRRAFFLEAGSVGADWLSPAVVTYVADQLIRGQDPEALQASQDFDWYIFPMSNPDGYEHTQITSDRIWHKNRRPVSGSAVGVDLTKNWNSQWGVSGGSHTMADSTYIGLGPFSEPETRHLSRFIESIGSTLDGFLSFRQHGQRLVLPFAHTTEPMYNYDQMLTVARRAVGALSARYGTQYTVGNSIDVADGATGNIVDWAKFRFNPAVAATYLLRPENSAAVRDPDTAFIFNVNLLQPTCEETFDSILAIIREARNLNVL